MVLAANTSFPFVAFKDKNIGGELRCAQAWSSVIYWVANPTSRYSTQSWLAPRALQREALERDAWRLVSVRREAWHLRGGGVQPQHGAAPPVGRPRGLLPRQLLPRGQGQLPPVPARRRSVGVPRLAVGCRCAAVHGSTAWAPGLNTLCTRRGDVAPPPDALPHTLGLTGRPWSCVLPPHCPCTRPPARRLHPWRRRPHQPGHPPQRGPAGGLPGPERRQQGRRHDAQLHVQAVGRMGHPLLQRPGGALARCRCVRAGPGLHR